jgi:activator of HSP90 ATPase
MNAKSKLEGLASPTRRELMASIFLAGCGSSLSISAWGQSKESKMASVPSSDANKSRTSLHQEIDYKASAERIYQVLLSSKDFSAFSGAAAEIDPKPGGSFSMFGGLVGGATLNWCRTRGSCRRGACRRSLPRERIRWLSSN